MTFFKQLMRLAAAAGAVALLKFLPDLIALFQGPAPSDISPMIWGILGTLGVAVLNWLVSKIPQPGA